MALVVKDRVRETSTTTGTGTITLAGAVTGYQSFSAIGNANTTYYTIYLQGGNEWEVGIGTYTASGTTLSRDTILASSNGGSAVNFSAGVKDVFVTYPAGRSVYYDTATNVTLNALTLSGGTANGVLYLNGSKVATSGSALTFDGTNLGVSVAAATSIKAIALSTTQANLRLGSTYSAGGGNTDWSLIQAFSAYGDLVFRSGLTEGADPRTSGTTRFQFLQDGTAIWSVGGSESMRLTSTGLHLGTSFTSISNRLQVAGNAAIGYTTAAPTTGLIVAGNVGIGTDSPSAKLDVQSASGLIRVTSTTGTNTTNIGFTNSGGSFYVGLDSSTGGNFGAGNYGALIYNGANSPMVFFTNGTEKARIDTSGTLILRQSSNAANTSVSFNTTVQNALTLDSSGNLGVGTTSIGARIVASGTTTALDSSGQIFATVTDSVAADKGGQIMMGGYYTGTTTTAFGGLAAKKENATSGNFAGYLQFLVSANGTGNVERARITSGGNFYLGTQTALASTAKLQISNGTDRAIATAGSSGDLSVEGLRIGKFDNDSTTSQLFVRFTINNDNAGSGQINANGASAAAFGTYSDERLKKNIVSLSSQLSNICALRPVEFDYKDGSGHQIGFIAQEMQTVYPDVVGSGDDEMLMITGWSKTEARLVKAIQEQQAMINELKAEVAALKGA